MNKAKTSVKIAVASAVAISSTAAVIYAAPKILDANSSTSSNTKVYLDVEKVDADTIKVSLDNIEDIAKSLQFSIKLDGKVKLKDGENGINDLINKEVESRVSSNGYSVSNSVFTDYTYNEDANTIDVLITAEDSLPKTENKIEIFELDIIPTGANEEAAQKFNILPNGEDNYKYVSKTNKEYSDIAVEYDKNLISLNTAPTVEYVGTENIKLFDGDALVFNDIKDIVTNDVEGDEVTLEVRNITNIEESKEDSQQVITQFSSEDIGTYTFKVYALDSKGDKSEAIKILVDVSYDLSLTSPTINGVEDVELQSGDIFKPLDGVKATDAKGRNLTVNVSGDLNLNPEKDTEYTLKYSATDKYEKTTEIERKVKVIANQAPVITGADNIVINIGDKFDPKDGIKAIDDIDGDLTSDIIINGQVNTSIAGEYKITYTVTDKGNKTTRAQRIVRVNRSPIVTGYDSTLVVKDGIEVTKEMILGGINITDETDYIVDVEIPTINGVGRYEATIIATDSDKASTIVKRGIVIAAEAVTELPNSGQGTSESDAKIIQVLEADGINILNEKLSDATKEYSITTTKKKLTSYTQYSFIIAKKEAAFRNTDKIYVNVRVPNDIEESTGGIVITEYVEVFATEVSIDNKDNLNSYISKGDELNLSATIKPDNTTNKELDWISTNEEVLEIVKTENGVKVIAKEYGIATIKVGAVDGSERYDEVTFNISHDIKELPEGITVVGGDASEDSPVTYKTESIEALKELLSNAKEEFKVVLQDKKVLGEEVVEYYLKIQEKGLISRMLGNANSYYIAVRVPNTDDFESLLYALEKDDTKAPTLIYNGLTEIIIENGSEFELPIVKVVDNLDKDITVKHVIKNSDNKIIDSINTTITGEYTIKYSASDLSGNKSEELIINVIVRAKVIADDVELGEGNGTIESPAEIIITENTTVETITNLIDDIKESYNVVFIAEPKDNGDNIIFKIKLEELIGKISTLFGNKGNIKYIEVKIPKTNTAVLEVFYDLYDSTVIKPEEPELPGEGLGPDGGVLPEVKPEEPELPGEGVGPDGEVLPEVTPEGPNTAVKPEEKEDSDLPQAGGRNALGILGFGAIITSLGGLLVYKKKKK